MFLILLLVSFVLSLIVSGIVALVFRKPIDNILNRIISDAVSKAWTKYLTFAILVVGISSGVRLWDFEKYITPLKSQGGEVIALNRDRWIMEVVRTILGSLQGIAWLLLVFFIFALIAYVIVRAFELRKPKSDASIS